MSLGRWHEFAQSGLSFAANRRSRCGSVRGCPLVSSHFSPGAAPQVEHWTASASSRLSFFSHGRKIMPYNATQNCSILHSLEWGLGRLRRRDGIFVLGRSFVAVIMHAEAVFVPSGFFLGSYGLSAYPAVVRYFGHGELYASVQSQKRILRHMVVKPPKNLSQLIDRIDQIREELLTIQQSMEKMETPKTPASNAKGKNTA